MASEKELRVKITADSVQFLNGMKSAETGLKNFSDKAAVHTTAVTSGLGAMSSMLGTIGITLGAAGVVTFLKNSATAAVESERATSRLKATIDNIGISYDTYSFQIQAAIDASSKYALVQDEEVSDVLQKLVLQTGNLKTSLNNLNLTMDISRAANVDYETAATILSKVLNGNIEAAGRYFPALKRVASALSDNATAHDRAEAGIKFLSEKVDGAAGKMGEYEKAIKGVTLQWEDFKEKAGAPVLSAFSEITTAIQNAFTWMEKFRTKWKRDWEFDTGGMWKEGVPWVPWAPPWDKPKGETPASAGGAPTTPGGTGGGGGSGFNADADRKKEEAFRKGMDAAERWGNYEFNFQQQVADMRNQKHEEWMKQEDEKAAKSQETEDLIWQAVEEGNRKATEAEKERRAALSNSFTFIVRSALISNKAFFAITKATDMAQATMDTYAAATKALASVPYPYNFAVAALVTAAGMANVAKIASTSFGGKGSGGSAAGSATSGAGIGAQGSTFVANQPTQSMQVIVHGNIVDHAAFVRELQPYFKEVVVDTV